MENNMNESKNEKEELNTNHDENLKETQEKIRDCASNIKNMESKLKGIKQEIEWISTDLFPLGGMVIISPEEEYYLKQKYNELNKEYDELENKILEESKRKVGLEEMLLKELNSKGDSEELIKNALDNANRIVMGKDEKGKDRTYLDLMLEQRIEGPDNAGSSYKVSSKEELYEKLINQKWTETTHPEVMPGCRVFKTDLEGLEGILDLDKLPDDIEIYAVDPKGTGKVGMGVGNVEKNPVKETYLIIGKENIDGKEEDVVFTFHPGEPVRPSMIQTSDIKDGQKMTKNGAKALGFDKVKYLSEEMLEAYRRKSMQFQSSVSESKQKDSDDDELEL